jgi:hypothetical protein
MAKMKSVITLQLYLLLFLSTAFSPFSAMAQTPEVFPFGQIHSFESAALGQTRVLNIWLPQGYNPDSNQTYPVIFVLDGSAHEDFPHIAGLVQFLNMYELAPKSIVVGIANVNRYHDFTHPTQDPEDLKAIPTGGGSEAFIRFLETEVQPYVQLKFKTNGQRTLIGQSAGGLLAMEVLLKHPHLFENYLIVSPSTWWNRESLLQEAPALLAKQPPVDKTVYIAYGKEHPVMMRGAKTLAKHVKKYAGEGTRVQLDYLSAENHATILHNAAYKGLCFIK